MKEDKTAEELLEELIQAFEAFKGAIKNAFITAFSKKED